MPTLKVPGVNILTALGAFGQGLAPHIPGITANIQKKRKEKEKQEADYRTLKALLDSPQIANSPMGRIISGLITPRGDFDRLSPEEQGMLATQDPQTAMELYSQGDKELKKNASNILANLQRMWPVIAKATTPPKETTPFKFKVIPGKGVGVFDARTGELKRIIESPEKQLSTKDALIAKFARGEPVNDAERAVLKSYGIQNNQEAIQAARVLELDIRSKELGVQKQEKELVAGPSPQDILAGARTRELIREEKLAPTKEVRETIRFGLEKRKRTLELKTMRKKLRETGKTKKDYKRADSILKGIYNAVRKRGAEGWEQVIAFLNKGTIPKTVNVDSATAWERYNALRSSIATWEPWEREYVLTNMRALYGDSPTASAVWTRDGYNKQFAELKRQNPSWTDEQIRTQMATEKDLP